MKKHKPLARFEGLAQRLLEGTLDRVLGSGLDPAVISAQLLKAMAESEQNGEVANHYIVGLHPTDFAAYETHWPQVVQELENTLRQVISETGRTLPGQLNIELVTDDQASRHEARVIAERQEATDDTTFLRQQDPGYAERVIQALDAFLIVEGHRHVPLDRPFLTIGRHVDNEVVIDHPAVSRQHAQIRWRYGHFVLYDVGSRGGTQVNGQSIQEWVLHPGDVIYLARRVPIIYGEGLESRTVLAALNERDGQETMVLPAKSKNT